MFVQYSRRRLLAVISWESNSKGFTFRCLVTSSRSTQDIDATFSTKNLQPKTGINIRIKRRKQEDVTMVARHSKKT